MNLQIFKEMRRFQPPFENDLKTLEYWLSRAVGTAKVAGSFCGVYFFAPRVFVMSSINNDLDKVLVRMPNGDKHIGTLKSEATTAKVRFYTIKKPIADWHELPNRQEALNKDTFAFSYVPGRTPEIVTFKPLPLDESKTYADFEVEEDGVLPVNLRMHSYTYPIVDRCGCFIALGIGSNTDCSECVANAVQVQPKR